jgi:hypothetical protein
MTRKLPIMIAAVVSLTTGVACSSANATSLFVYETGTNDPWGNTTNNSAMDSAFGSGNWTGYNGFTASAFTGTKFVFLDGSDSNSSQLQSFLAANGAQIDSYVQGGGHVFINDAPNEGSGSFGLGFGVTLNWGGYSYPYASESATVSAAGVAAGLTNGGIATDYTGNYFSHATVSGPISNLVYGSNGTIFGAESYGAGLAAFGGQTTTNFHSPSPDGEILLVNELLYAANGAVIPTGVPETSTWAMMLLGFAGLGFAGYRRNKAATFAA